MIRQSLVWNRSPFRTFEFREHSAAHVSLSSIFSFQRTDTANAMSWACLHLASDPVECRSRGSLDLDQLSRNSEANFFVASSVAAVVGEAYIGGGPSECQQRFPGILLFFALPVEPSLLPRAEGLNRGDGAVLTASAGAFSPLSIQGLRLYRRRKAAVQHPAAPRNPVSAPGPDALRPLSGGADRRGGTRPH